MSLWKLRDGDAKRPAMNDSEVEKVTEDAGVYCVAEQLPCFGYDPPYRPEGGRAFVAYIHWNGLAFLALGVSLWLGGPNLELHFPGGFLRVGWRVDRRALTGAFGDTATTENSNDE